MAVGPARRGRAGPRVWPAWSWCSFRSSPWLRTRGSTSCRWAIGCAANVARGFGKRTVAEFVDSAETVEMLRQLQVDFAQGFHVGQPMSREQLIEQTCAVDAELVS